MLRKTCSFIVVLLLSFQIIGAVEPSEYVTVQQGHLFRNGQRVRMFGVNMTLEGLYVPPAYPRIDATLDRLGQMGFNAIRLWPHVAGINFFYGQTADSTKELSKAQKGDGSLLDLHDYLIAQTQKRGMLIQYCGLHCIRLYPSDYDILPETSPADRDAWQKAIVEPSAKSWWLLQFVDPRVKALVLRHVKHVLNHVNPYTGRTIAQEPNIACFEMTNENQFVWTTLAGQFDRWPPYFQKQLQARWNEWLVQKYKNRRGVLAAWGEMLEDEDPCKGTVRLAPLTEKPIIFEDKTTGPFPRRRQVDFKLCLQSLYEKHYQEWAKLVRSQAPAGVGSNIVPLAADTVAGTWLSCAESGNLGDVFCSQPYFFDIREGKEPWVCWASVPPPWKIADLWRIKDKPLLWTETNRIKPDRYRAEYPMQLAALSAWQDGDGIFFYVWQTVGVFPKTLAEYTSPARPLDYATTQHVWTGANLIGDEITLSQMRIASAAFLNGLLPVAANPTTFAIGKRTLRDPAFCIGRGANTYYDTVYRHELWNEISRTAYLKGSRIKLSPEGDFALRCSGSVRKKAFPDGVSPDSHIGWKRGKGYFFVDDKSVKVAIGYLPETVSFSDGVEVTGLNVPFACFTMVAEDGKSIAESDQVLVSLVSTAENSGVQFDPAKMKKNSGMARFAQIVGNPGTAPVQVVRPTAFVQLPSREKRRAIFLDYAFKVLGEESAKDQLKFDGKRPTFLVRLTGKQQD